MSIDWFKEKSTGNHRFSRKIWGFPVKLPLNESMEPTTELKFHSKSEKLFIYSEKDLSSVMMAVSSILLHAGPMPDLSRS